MKLSILAFLLTLGAFAPPPAPPNGDVSTFLKNVGLEEYSALFEQEDINFEILPELTEETLRTIGIRSLGQRLRIIRGVRNLEIEVPVIETQSNQGEQEQEVAASGEELASGSGEEGEEAEGSGSGEEGEEAEGSGEGGVEAEATGGTGSFEVETRGTEEPIWWEEKCSSGRHTQRLTIGNDRFDRKYTAKSGLVYFKCNERPCGAMLSARYTSRDSQNFELPIIEKLPGPHLMPDGTIHPPNTGKRLKELAKFKIKKKIEQDPLRSIPVIYEEVVFQDILPSLSDETERLEFLQTMPSSHNSAR